MTRILCGIAAVCFLVLFASKSMAQRIISCEVEWAQLAREIGGDKVKIDSLATGNQDAHHITPTARSIALVREADLLICNDIRDERNLRLLVQNAGNRRIQPGQRGYMEAGAYVTGGAVQGPAQFLAWRHVQRDPHNILLVADALTKRLTEIDSVNAGYYQARYQAFSKKWSEAIRAWQERALPLKGLAVVEQRKSCAYLCRWLGIQEIAAVEPAEGGSTNVKEMRGVLTSLANRSPSMIIKGPYHASPAVSWLKRQTGLPLVVLPATRDHTAGADGLYAMFDETIDRMLSAASRTHS